MSCFRTLFKSLLVVCNLVFALVGTALLAIALYVRLDTHWSNLFLSPTYGFHVVYFFVGLGASIMLLSLMGMVGAVRESKPLLVPYLLVVFVALVLQVVGATTWFNFNSAFTRTINGEAPSSMSDIQREVMEHVEDQTMAIWNNGGCTIDLSNLLTPASCADKRVNFLADLVNERCVPDGVVDGDTLSTVFAKAVTGAVDLDLQQVSACVGSDPTKANHARIMYCACQKEISKELSAIAQPVAISMTVIAGVELLLFVCACVLICRRRRRRDTDGNSNNTALLQPVVVVAQGGINMV